MGFGLKKKKMMKDDVRKLGEVVKKPEQTKSIFTGDSGSKDLENIFRAVKQIEDGKKKGLTF